jgi:hypothetical protein
MSKRLSKENKNFFVEYTKEELELREKASPNCKKCFGTGNRGHYISYGGVLCPETLIKCSCVLKKEQKEKDTF